LGRNSPADIRYMYPAGSVKPARLGLFFDFGQIGKRAFELVGEVLELKHSFDAGEHLDFVYGLGDEIVCAAIDRPLHIAKLMERGNHNDGDMGGRRVIFQLAADLKAAHFRHHNVEQDEVGLVFSYDIEGFGAVAGGDCPAVDILKIGLEQFEVFTVIVNDEDNGRFGGLVIEFFLCHSNSFKPRSILATESTEVTEKKIKNSVNPC
jgi:hypothetical protein